MPSSVPHDSTTVRDPVAALATMMSTDLPDRHVLRAAVAAAWSSQAFASTTDRQPDRAMALTLAALRGESDHGRREALRLACALAMRAGGHFAKAEALFEPDALWTPDRPSSATTLVGLTVAGGGWSPWQAAGLEQVARQAPAKLAQAALRERFAIARRAGVDARDLRRLFALFMRFEPRPPRLARSLAGLIWLFGSPSLVRPLFAACPALARDAAMDPVVAGLMRRGAWHAARGSERSGVRAAAERLARVEHDSARFWRRLANRSLSIAVVGNSPCETGRGRGAQIDGHDVVIRFNGAPEDGRFAADYGARTDAKALATQHLRSSGRESRAPIAIAVRQTAMERGGISLGQEVSASGRSLVFAPLNVVTTLRLELGASPSAGMVMLGHLRRLRGSLDGVGCFGFSFTDQTGSDPTSAHYFETATAGQVHGWEAERALFDAWMRERSAANG